MSRYGGEYSRSGKPKKAYKTKAEADRVAALHPKTYGTIATSYQGRDGSWHVTTDRRATASKQVADQVRNRAQVQHEMMQPTQASDLRTGAPRHGPSAAQTMALMSGARPGSPMEGIYSRQLREWNAPGGVADRLLPNRSSTLTG